MLFVDPWNIRNSSLRSNKRRTLAEMLSTALLWLSIKECRALVTVIAIWESLHGLNVDDITKEHTSPASDVLYLFMGTKDDVQHTKHQTRDQTKMLSSELGVRSGHVAPKPYT